MTLPGDLPLGADGHRVEEHERRGHDVGIDIAEHAAAARDVEVDAVEPELTTVRIRGGIEHEARRSAG